MLAMSFDLIAALLSWFGHRLITQTFWNNLRSSWHNNSYLNNLMCLHLLHWRCVCPSRSLWCISYLLLVSVASAFAWFSRRCIILLRTSTSVVVQYFLEEYQWHHFDSRQEWCSIYQVWMIFVLIVLINKSEKGIFGVNLRQNGWFVLYKLLRNFRRIIRRFWQPRHTSEDKSGLSIHVTLRAPIVHWGWFSWVY